MLCSPKTDTYRPQTISAQAVERKLQTAASAQSVATVAATLTATGQASCTAFTHPQKSERCVGVRELLVTATQLV